MGAGAAPKQTWACSSNQRNCVSASDRSAEAGDAVQRTSDSVANAAYATSYPYAADTGTDK